MYNHPIKNKNGQYLATKEQYNKLVHNHETNEGGSKDYAPVIKLFTPMASCTWLISELDPNTGMMFGLCDLGMGFPELGSVSLAEILEEWIERDEYTNLPDVPMSKYVEVSTEYIQIPKPAPSKPEKKITYRQAIEYKARNNKTVNKGEWNINTWRDKYQPVTNPRGTKHWDEGIIDDWMTRCAFDTIGEDKEWMVKNDITNDYVWTWQEFDGDWILSQGYHMANRLGYFVTENPHNKKDLTEVVITDYDLAVQR
jgi:hypothetical protein